ncbi:fungal-specific transcription factor domain-containing protein [Xylaria cf. heliscus]|nr:fungal-specific transcription factor domain-containing protein [Xylaria cf. heliscus]
MNERKSCHNCRRRRLRCDRSVPACFKCSKTGQKCLGYGKIFRWVDSEGPVGPVGHRGQGQGQSQGQSAALTISTESDGWFRDRAHGRKLYDNSTPSRPRDGPQQTLNIFLADPLLQDLSGSSRYYLSYFASRFCQDLVVHDSAERGTNPFRELIPMSQTYSYLQHIIIAVSAVHYYHAVRNATSESASVPQNALIDALRARQDAIRELIDIIQERRTGDRRAESQADQDALLATVLFFVNFTLIDSGKDGWKDHLTAAGRLLSLYVPPTTVPLFFCAKDGDDTQSDCSSPSTPDLTSLSDPITPQDFLKVESQRLSACDYVTSDTVAYFIWNCALESLVSPSRSSSSMLSSTHAPDYAAQPLTWDVTQVLKILSRTEANSYHSCPTYLMGIVLRIARITQYLKTSGSRSPAAAQMDAYISLLKEAEAFDVEEWAAGVSTHIVGMLGVMNEQELRLRCHIAATYRAAVCLYILLVAPGLPAEIRRRARLSSGDGDLASLPTLPTTRDLASTIFQQLSSIPKTSPLFKYTLWPVFLTGVDAVAEAHRLWVIERLRAMREVCPWGMLTSAMETLAEIWQLRDGTVERERDVEDEAPEVRESVEDSSDWLARLQGLKIDCLIV